jgi:hypothetical protein
MPNIVFDKDYLSFSYVLCFVVYFTARSESKYFTVEWQKNGRMTKWKGFGRKRSCHIVVLARYFIEGQKKTTET